MPFFDIFASPRWLPLRMRTKVVSFSYFSKRFRTKKIKALRPKMTKIASRGSCLKFGDELMPGQWESDCFLMIGTEKAGIEHAMAAPYTNCRGWLFEVISSYYSVTFPCSLHKSNEKEKKSSNKRLKEKGKAHELSGSGTLAEREIIDNTSGQESNLDASASAADARPLQLYLHRRHHKHSTI